MLKIIITNATIVTMSHVIDLIIKRGYVYVENGVIKAVGPGEPPPEYEYADYVIEGKGKIVTPGLCIGYFDIYQYLLRFSNKKKITELLSTISRNDTYYITLITLAGLLMKGISCIGLVLSKHHEFAARAVKDLYILTRILIPATTLQNIPNAESIFRKIVAIEPKVIKPGIIINKETLTPKLLNLAKSTNSHIYLLGDIQRDKVKEILGQGYGVTVLDPDPMHVKELSSIKGLNLVVTDRSLSSWCPNSGIGVFEENIDIFDNCKKLLELGKSSIDIFASLTTWGAAALGLSNMGSIEPGRIALLSIFNIQNPQVWPIAGDMESLFRALVSGNVPVETVIIRDDIVIDNSELLTAGESVLQKARDRISDILKSLDLEVF